MKIVGNMSEHMAQMSNKHMSRFQLFIYFYGGYVMGYGEQVKWFEGCCGGCVVVVIGLRVVVEAGFLVVVGS